MTVYFTHNGERRMIVNIHEDAANTALDAIGTMMNGGSIELLSSSGNVLAVLKLSNPAAMRAADSQLEFNAIRETDAQAQGVATSARVVARDGGEVFSCDVGDANSDAVVKLNPVMITRGAPVRLNSFRLVMP